MVLDLIRDLDEWQIFSSPREARVDMRKSHDKNRWRGQLSFPIFIVEKDTMEPVCRTMAQGCALGRKVTTRGNLPMRSAAQASRRSCAALYSSG
jgi:hypothetical protein